MVKSISKLNTVGGFLLRKNTPVQDGLSGVFARASAERSVQQQLGEGNPVSAGWCLCASVVLLSASSQLPLEAAIYPVVLSQMGFRYFKETKNYSIHLHDDYPPFCWLKLEADVILSYRGLIKPLGFAFLLPLKYLYGVLACEYKIYNQRNGFLFG